MDKKIFKFLIVGCLITSFISCTTKEDVEKEIEGDYETRIVSVMQDSLGFQTSDTTYETISVVVKEKDRVYFSNPDETFNYDPKDGKIFHTDASGRFEDDSLYLFVNEAFQSDYTLFEGKRK